MVLDWFKKFKNNTDIGLQRGFTSEGLVVGPELSGPSFLDVKTLRNRNLPALIAQFLDEGVLIENGKNYIVPWASLMIALDFPGPEEFGPLEIPSISKFKPELKSYNSFADEDFAITIGRWFSPDGQILDSASLVGGLLVRGNKVELIEPVIYELMHDIQDFHRRAPELRNIAYHKEVWGSLRQKAVSGGMSMDALLRQTIIVTPDKLELRFNNTRFNDDSVVEIEPWFEGAPDNWLETFDRRATVLSRYDTMTERGLVEIVITDKVKEVLREIKAMPARRVAGSKAKQFCLNPFSVLGQSSGEVLDAEQIELEQLTKGLLPKGFRVEVERDPFDYPISIKLIIENVFRDASIEPKNVDLLVKGRLHKFIDKLSQAIAEDAGVFTFEGDDLEVNISRQWELKKLVAARESLSAPRLHVHESEIFDLSAYSSRIEGFGTAKKVVSPFIQRVKEEEGWIPQNTIPMLVFTPEGMDKPIALPLTDDIHTEIAKKIELARANGSSVIDLPRAGGLIPIIDIEETINILDEFKKGKIEPGTDTTVIGDKDRASVFPAKTELLVIDNVEQLEHYEGQFSQVESQPRPPRLPTCLHSQVELKEHQLFGLSKIQQLYNAGEDNVRGMILADDMGLGKTVQLLSFLVCLYEQFPSARPTLIVAPVSLLENWRAEVEKFFSHHPLKILMAYGNELKSLRAKPSEIQKSLLDKGLKMFLRPGWLEDANVVLTTYETLRDLDITFARERWEVMICDEAQKIKNPATMVTRAAKKQNVRFKIACTGTPVENSLTDLWCLMDFVHPGLLSALNEFSKYYRRPIEAEGDKEASIRIDELREIIRPLILRRMKSEVARDLKRKIENVYEIPFSDYQHNLYVTALAEFSKTAIGDADASSEATYFSNHLALIQFLRQVCTDPRPPGLRCHSEEDSFSEYSKRSPKLAWLFGTLEAIKDVNEKCIIFIEYRELQQVVHRFIRERFNLEVSIINGSTSTNAQSVLSRQKQIDKFQQSLGFNIIILSPIAVGFGVNIQAANHVIHYTRHYNPAKEDQATDRAYRIGQEKDVMVYLPVAVAKGKAFKTFDQKLHELLGFKRSLAQDMLNGYGVVSLADFGDITDIGPQEAVDDLNKPLTLQQVLSLDWLHLEKFAAAMFNELGYKIYLTPRTDNGVDVVAIRNGEGYLIQVKQTSLMEPIGWEAVKEVVAGSAFYEKRHPKIKFKKAVFTNFTFGAQAVENASLNNVEIFERPQIQDFLSKSQIAYRKLLMFQHPQDADAFA